MTRRVQDHPRKAQDTFSVYVRAWDDIDSMPTFFAMLRAVEKRFGRARDFRLGRDYDIKSNYTNFFVVDLATEDAYRRVPENGTNIQVEIPVTPRTRPGGVGLDEIQDMLSPQDWDPLALYSTPISPLTTAEGAPERKTKTVEVIVKRSTSPQTEGRHRRRMKDSSRFGQGFYKWAGFYDATVEDGAPLYSKEMTRVMEKWAGFLAEQGKLPGAESRTRGGAAADELDLRADAADVFGSGHGLAQAPDASAASSHPVPDVPQDRDASFIDFSIDSAAKVQPSPDSPPSPPPPVRLSQREKILQRARQHAKTPLPEPSSPVAEAERKMEEAARAEEEKQTTATLRERLMRLAGGKWL
ncbi:hypothetical protein C2E23DRAFT_721491 [Lenzites betulinus]|nr:hypothetical protein C2E23DRAFT_721491 [Lenzites betulinus]